MKRLAYAIGVSACVASSTWVVSAAGRYDQNLSDDRQIVHVLNRMLTFGRPSYVRIS